MLFRCVSKTYIGWWCFFTFSWTLMVSRSEVRRLWQKLLWGCLLLTLTILFVTGRRLGTENDHDTEVYVSHNYGRTFTTVNFTLFNGNRATISQFVNSPVYNTHVSGQSIHVHVQHCSVKKHTTLCKVLIRSSGMILRATRKWL